MPHSRKDICAFTAPVYLGGDGLRVAVKDCIDIEGMVTSCGSAAFRAAAPATRNADVVDTLLADDCHIVGKANMHELAYGMTGVNAAFGTPVNPRWPDRIPGGSSSGSAVAVAAGLCDFAVGTDTGGSIRQPAICCGLYGIKPSFDRISRAGCHPAQSSLDCVGILAPSADALTVGMCAIDPNFHRETCSQAPRMGFATGGLSDTAATEAATLMAQHTFDAAEISLPTLDDAFDAGLTVMGYEAAQSFGPLLEASAPLGADIRQRLTSACTLTEDDLATANIVRDQFTAEVDNALDAFDVLITPALTHFPPTLEAAKDPSTILPLTRFLRPFNLSGHPAIVLPMTVGPDRLPAGVQIVGRKGSDAKLCAVAEWMTETTNAFQLEES